ncbi:CaiB/BaiF CoA-transferase family protein [Pseudonocardia sp. ICBG1293]|uniref:CaiB/BaiF CoA transferase family protein n=1 Tax=Pseudonocardia sp. ICBG1293 TaxID=2844382 RepID=UPI001CCFCB19|nr:CoA transferase [Pseudonocardia sp. ICBG1293]
MPEPSGALDGIRVLDLSRFIAGPLCAQILGDLGADVIKVERPGGEDARGLGPFLDGESLYVATYNRNKRAMTVDTRNPDGVALLADLVARCDVLVENYRPGTMAAMGLSHERLAELNPRLVVVSLSGFGQDGPMAGRALFDAIAQAMSGLMSRTGRAEDPPLPAGTFVADHLTGVYGALGAVTALHHRTSTGRGQVVDVASLDALFSCLGTTSVAAANGVAPAERTGSRDPLSGPANTFPTRDGWIYLHAGTDPLFPRLCAAMGRPSLADGAWRDVAGRMADIEAVEAEVTAWTRELSTEDVSAALDEQRIRFGPVLTVDEAAALPQLAARGMLVEGAHSTLGSITQLGMPVKLGEAPASLRRGVPAVGEHTGQVLAELLGLDEERIATLRASGAI